MTWLLFIQVNRGSILPWFNLNRGQNRHVNTLVEWLQLYVSSITGLYKLLHFYEIFMVS